MEQTYQLPRQREAWCQGSLQSLAPNSVFVWMTLVAVPPRGRKQRFLKIWKHS